MLHPEECELAVLGSGAPGKLIVWTWAAEGLRVIATRNDTGWSSTGAVAAAVARASPPHQTAGSRTRSRHPVGLRSALRAASNGQSRRASEKSA